MLRSVLHGLMHEVISDISKKKRRTGGGEELSWEATTIIRKPLSIPIQPRAQSSTEIGGAIDVWFTTTYDLCRVELA